MKKTTWILVRTVFKDGTVEWQVSDGPAGNRSASYDFLCKKEAVKFLQNLNSSD